MTISGVALTEGSNETDQTAYVTAAVGPTAGRLLILAVDSTHATTPADPASVTGLGLTWVLVDSQSYNTIAAPKNRISVYRAMGSPTAGPVTITFGSARTGCSWSLSEFSGVDTSGTNGSGAIVQSLATQADAVSSGFYVVTLAPFSNVNNGAYGAVGWAATGVVPDPDPGDPDPSVRPTALNTGYTGALTPTGGRTISVAGTVIENEIISGRLTVTGSNVIVRNCKIQSGDFYGIYQTAGSNLLVEDCEIVGQTAAGISGASFTARRCNIHSQNGGDGIKTGTGSVVEYCYIHDQILTATSHNDGIQHSGGNNARFTGNAFERISNASIIIKSDFANINNVIVEDNWIDYGNFSLYVRVDSTGRTVTGITVRNNKFGRHPQYGPSSFDVPVTSYANTWMDAPTAKYPAAAGAAYNP